MLVCQSVERVFVCRVAVPYSALWLDLRIELELFKEKYSYLLG